MPSPELLGPLALTVAALYVIRELWREHLAADADDRAQRDTAIIGWRDQTAATNRLADAIEQRNRDDVTRQRRGD